MALEYIKSSYGVPAELGCRIEYSGRDKPVQGTIQGHSDAHLLVLLDGDKHALPFHPTWKIRYLDKQ
jgi:hypothetical protein